MGTTSRPGSRWSATCSVAAGLLLWAALVAPHRPTDLHPTAFLRLPVEGVVLIGVLLFLPPRARRAVAAFTGLALAVLCLLKALDLGFRLALDRPFDVVADRGYAGPAIGLLFDSVGTAGGVAALAGIALTALAVLLALPLATLRVGTLVGTHRAGALRTGGALLTAWTVLAASGASLGGGAIASTSATRLALDQARQIPDGIREERRFADALRTDPLADTSAREALSGLRGKDVLVVFVESYGRFAVQGPSAGPVRAVLDESTRQLERAGFHSRSAFLTSPTFGGVSWLAHATLHSGLWVERETQYDRLLASERTSLMSLFRDAGWRTVVDIPSSARPWPEGQEFYCFHVMYGGADVGYTGPEFGYAKVPDQFTLEALYQLELARPDRPPVMAEVDLVSSHTPWTPLPRLVPWEALGDGSIYTPMADNGDTPAALLSDQGRRRAAYTTAVVYALRSVVEFVGRYGDEDLVVVLLGDHQPSAVVTGPGAGRDVPVSVLAADPAVVRRISGWGWQAGLRPGPEAPVWRMDAFRDRFLDAFGTPPRTSPIVRAEREE